MVLYSAVRLAPGSSAVVMHLQLHKNLKVLVGVFSLRFRERVVPGEACSCGRGFMFWRFSTSSQAEEPSAVPSLPNQTGARTTRAGVLSLWLVWPSSYAVSSARRCDKTITLPDSHAWSLDTFVDAYESFLVLSHHVTCSGGVNDGFSNSVWACSFLTWLFAISARTFRSLQN